MRTLSPPEGVPPLYSEHRGRRAFDDWFVRQMEKVLPALQKRASRLTRGSHVGDDLVQATCLRAWQARASFDPDQKLAPWLFTILRNVWLDELRKTKGYARYVTAIDGDTLVIPQAANLQGEILDLHRAMNALQSQFRNVILLRGVLGLPHGEVGDLLGMTPVTARKTYSRALAQLRDTTATDPGTENACERSEQALMDKAMELHALLKQSRQVA